MCACRYIGSIAGRRVAVRCGGVLLRQYGGRPGNGASGRVAQLVERAPEKREVTGSMPVPTTNEFLVRALQLISLRRRSQWRATHVPQLEESRRSARVNNGFQRLVAATD